MRRLSPEELRGVWRHLAQGTRDLAHLPYTNLQPLRRHRFGHLRTWPKWKTLRPIWALMAARRKAEEEGRPFVPSAAENELLTQGWGALRWRPLVSYAGHRFKGLFRLLSQWCGLTERVLQLGFGVRSARGVLEKFHSFNEQSRRPYGVLHRRRGRGRARRWARVPQAARRLGRRILDIQDFFIRVPRHALAARISELIYRLKQVNPKWRFFSVEKRTRLSTDAEIPRDGLSQGGWRRVRPAPRYRMIFSEYRMRGWRSLALEDIIDLFHFEEVAAVVMVNGVPYLPIDGFQIGGTVAAGAACLWAASEEDRSLAQESPFVQWEVRTMCCICRWTDDILQFWDRGVSPATRRWLAKARSLHFYGPTLALKDQG